MNLADSYLLRHDLHRQRRALPAGIHFHMNKIIHFMAFALPHGKREKRTDSGNLCLLLVLSKTVQMMLCKFKNQV